MLLMNVLRRAKARLQRLMRGSRPKVFGIGLNKTGTTSLEKAFIELGFDVGPQWRFEQQFDDFIAGHHDRLFEQIDHHEAFQDIPFSLPGAYRVLHRRYPNAKFVLTLRDDADQWYQSICRFHAKMFAVVGHEATEEDLARAEYIQTGWALRVMRHAYPAPAGSPYDAASLKRVYEGHIKDTLAFFADKPGSLLVLNPGWPDAFGVLTRFLGTRLVTGPFPHENATRAPESVGEVGITARRGEVG